MRVDQLRVRCGSASMLKLESRCASFEHSSEGSGAHGPQGSRMVRIRQAFLPHLFFHRVQRGPPRP
jgi:hypothetical protein